MSLGLRPGGGGGSYVVNGRDGADVCMSDTSQRSAAVFQMEKKRTDTYDLSERAEGSVALRWVQGSVAFFALDRSVEPGCQQKHDAWSSRIRRIHRSDQTPPQFMRSPKWI